MKTLILLLGCSLAATAAVAQTNYFRPGTEWIYEGPATPATDSEPLWCRFFAGEERDVDGVKCFPIWQQYSPDAEPTVAMLARSEDERVYFLPSAESAEWKLMYDFSLQPDDECTIWHFVNAATPPEMTTVLCMEVETVLCMEVENDASMHNWPCITVKETGEGANTGLWLKGIGSASSAPWNSVTLPGDAPGLKCVKAAGEVVWGTEAGLESISATPQPLLTVSGKTLTATGSHLTVLTPDGSVIARKHGNAATHTVQLPSAGCYIVTIDRHVRKILAK